MSRDTNVPALRLGTPGTLVVMSTLLVPVGGADALEQTYVTASARSTAGPATKGFRCGATCAARVVTR